MTTNSAAPISALPIIQMLLALGLVLALVKWVIPMFLKKYGPRLTSKSSGGIHITETAALGQTTLAVVTVKGRTFLLGASAQQVNCLADLTEAQIAQEALPTFAELLDGEKRVEPKPTNPMGDLAGQLERLKSLGL
jgi:flagellar biogenesis protein FliO